MLKTIYGFDEDGKKVPIGTYNVIPDTKVGGTIFYIDNTADGTYTFYNAQGTQVSAPTVGTDCTGWTYEVTGASKDKFYVYNQNAMFPTGRARTHLEPDYSWTYLDESKGRVYELVGASGNGIGAGKTNTSTVMTYNNGVYIQGPEPSYVGPNYSYEEETIWYICDNFNKGTYTLNGSAVSNTTGCSDWYVPSMNELLAMKDAIGASTFANMLNYGGEVYPWSSTEASTEDSVDDSRKYAYVWGYDGGDDNYYPSGKSGSVATALALCRSF